MESEMKITLFCPKCGKQTLDTLITKPEYRCHNCKSYWKIEELNINDLK